MPKKSNINNVLCKLLMNGIKDQTALDTRLFMSLKDRLAEP